MVKQDQTIEPVVVKTLQIVTGASVVRHRETKMADPEVEIKARLAAEKEVAELRLKTHNNHMFQVRI